MRALRMEDYGSLRLVDIPIPTPGPDEVLLRIATTGVCGSDFHGLTGENGRRVPGQIMGHESAGTIAALGSDVDVEKYPIGAGATFNPVIVPTSSAAQYFGREQHHPEKTVVGVAAHYQSSFADYLTVPARNIVLLDPRLPLYLGALVEPIAVALHAVRRVGVRPGSKAVVIGGGPIGQSVVLALQIEGVDDIVLSEPSAPRRDVAAKLGAIPFGPNQNNVVDKMAAEFGGPADFAIDAVGTSPTMRDALASTRLGGSVVLVGMGSPDIELSAFAISTEERTIVGSFTYNSQDFADAATWVGSHAGAVAPMVSEIIAPDAAPNAFSRLANGDPIPGKILVKFDETAGI